MSEDTSTHECPGWQGGGDPDAKPLNISEATDREWHLSPAHPHGFCGGCGLEASYCHPGRCCTEYPDRLGVHNNVCGLCPDRIATGQVPYVGAPAGEA